MRDVNYRLLTTFLGYQTTQGRNETLPARYSIQYAYSYIRTCCNTHGLVVLHTYIIHTYILSHAHTWIVKWTEVWWMQMREQVTEC